MVEDNSCLKYIFSPILMTIATGESEIRERIQGEPIGRWDRPDLKTYSKRNKVEETIMQST